MSPVLPAPFLLDLLLSPVLGVVKRLDLTFHFLLLARHAPFFLADRQLLANLVGTQPSVVVALIHEANPVLVAGRPHPGMSAPAIVVRRELLTDAAYHTHDPEIEQQVRELAAQGLDRTGRFGKGRWEEIIRIADLHAKRS